MKTQANSPPHADKSPEDNAAGSIKNPIIIKKYANRRLYNTHSSGYVTLENLNQMVRDNIEFIVCDAKTGDDITRSILTQIILEEENKEGQTLLPVSFLRQLISFYGDSIHQMTLPHYLEITMQSFQENQKQFRQMAQENFAHFFPISQIGAQMGAQMEKQMENMKMPNMPQIPAFQEMGKQNMAMMQNAMRMFNPLHQGQEDQGQENQGQEITENHGTPAAETDKAPPSKSQEEDIASLKAQLHEMQAQLTHLIKHKS